METALSEGGPRPDDAQPQPPELQTQQSVGSEGGDSKSKKKKKKKKKNRRKSLEKTQSEVEDMQAEVEDAQQEEIKEDTKEYNQQEDKEDNQQARDEEPLPGPPSLERTSSLDHVLKDTGTRVTSMFSRFTSKVGLKKGPSRTESAAKLEGVVPSPVKTAVKKLEVPEEKSLDDLPVRTKRDFFGDNEQSVHVSAEKEKYDALEKQRQLEKETEAAARAAAADKRTPPSSTTSNEETLDGSATTETAGDVNISLAQSSVGNADKKSTTVAESAEVAFSMKTDEATSEQVEVVSKESIDDPVQSPADNGVNEFEAESEMNVIGGSSDSEAAVSEAVVDTKVVALSVSEPALATSTSSVNSRDEPTITKSIEDTVSDEKADTVESVEEDLFAPQVLSEMSEIPKDIVEMTEAAAEVAVALPSPKMAAASVSKIDNQEDNIPVHSDMLPVTVSPPVSEQPLEASVPVQAEKLSPVKSLASRFEGKREQSLDSLKFRTVREFFPEERSIRVGAEKKKYEALTEQQKLIAQAEEEAKSKYKTGGTFLKSPPKEVSAQSVVPESKVETQNFDDTAAVVPSTTKRSSEFNIDLLGLETVAAASPKSPSKKQEPSESTENTGEAVTPVKSIASRFEGKHEQSLDSLKFRTVREFFPEERSVRVGSEKQKFEAQVQQQQDQSLDNLKFRTVREFFPEQRSVHVGTEKAKFEALTKQKEEAAKIAEQVKAKNVAESSLPSANVRSSEDKPIDLETRGETSQPAIDDGSAQEAAGGMEGQDVADIAGSSADVTDIQMQEQSAVLSDATRDLVEVLADVVQEARAEVFSSAADNEVQTEGAPVKVESETLQTSTDEAIDTTFAVVEEIDDAEVDLSIQTAENGAKATDVAEVTSTPVEETAIVTELHVNEVVRPSPPDRSLDVEDSSATGIHDIDTCIISTSDVIKSPEVVEDKSVEENTVQSTADVLVTSDTLGSASEEATTPDNVESIESEVVKEIEEPVAKTPQEKEQKVEDSNEGLAEISLDDPKEVELKEQPAEITGLKPRPMLTTERSFVMEDDHTIETEDTVVVGERPMTDGEDEFEPSSKTQRAHELYAGITSPKEKTKKALSRKNSSHSSKASPPPKLIRKASGSSTGSFKSPVTVPVPMKRASITAPTASYMAKKTAEAAELQRKSPPAKNAANSKLKGTVRSTGFVKPDPAARGVPVPMKRASITAPTASYMAKKAAEAEEAHQVNPPGKHHHAVKGTVKPTGPLPAAPTVPVPMKRASITAPTASWQARNVPDRDAVAAEPSKASKHHTSKHKGKAKPTGFIKPIPPSPTVPVAPKRASIMAPTASYTAKKATEQSGEFDSFVSKPAPAQNSRYSNIKSKVMEGIKSGSTHDVIRKTITKEEFILAERRKSLGSAGVSAILSTADRRASLTAGTSIEGPPEPFVRSALSRKKLDSTIPRYMNYENTPGYAQRAREQYERRKRLEEENAAKSEKRQRELRMFFAEKQQKSLMSNADEVRRGLEAHEFAKLAREAELEAKRALRKEKQPSRSTLSHHRASSATSSAGQSSSNGTSSRASKKSLSDVEDKTASTTAAPEEPVKVEEPVDISDKEKVMPDDAVAVVEGEVTLNEKLREVDVEAAQVEEEPVPSAMIDNDPELENVAKKINFDETSMDSEDRDISVE